MPKLTQTLERFEFGVFSTGFYGIIGSEQERNINEVTKQNEVTGNNELETESGRTKPLFALGCTIRLSCGSAEPGARIVGKSKPEQSHVFPEGEFDEKTATGIIEFVMPQLSAGERKFRIETSSECAPATALTFGLSLLFDTEEYFESGPLGGMVHNYLRYAYDRWRGRAWWTGRKAICPADPGFG